MNKLNKTKNNFKIFLQKEKNRVSVQNVMNNSIMKKLMLGLVFPAMFGLNVNASEEFVNSCRENQIESVKDFIAKDNKLIDAQDRFGWTPLTIASSQGNLDVVKLLVENGANLEGKNYCGFTALRCACVASCIIPSREEKCIEVMEYLIDQGADIDTQDNQGETPLCYASEFGDERIVALLLKKGAKIDRKAKIGNTALRGAVTALKEAVAASRDEMTVEQYNVIQLLLGCIEKY